LFDEISVCSSKSQVTDELIALFQESDRKTVGSGSVIAIDAKIQYFAKRKTILSRLDIMGYSYAVAREALNRRLQREREFWHDDSRTASEWIRKHSSALEEFSVDQWYALAPQALQREAGGHQPKDYIEQCMRADEGWLWFAGLGSLLSLRALLDACTEIENVTLDISELVFAGYLSEEEAICSDRRSVASINQNPLSTVVIIAEGSTDIMVLESSLSKLFPEYYNYFSFFNNGDVNINIDGGVSHLVRFLKAFAVARAPFRMVALFDNDTAGLQALRSASTPPLPKNIVAIALPNIEIAQKYPTVGPQGCHLVDINGRAVSIELFLGSEALAADGGLRPVRWTSYDKLVGEYQGELEGKRDALAVFRTALARYSSPQEARDAFPELVTLWGAIFRAAAQSAEEAILHSAPGA
jgi:hypothetical protein